MNDDFVVSMNILARRVSKGSKRYTVSTATGGFYTLRVYSKDNGSLLYQRELNANQLNSTLSGVEIEQTSNG